MRVLRLGRVSTSRYTPYRVSRTLMQSFRGLVGSLPGETGPTRPSKVRVEDTVLRTVLWESSTPENSEFRNDPLTPWPPSYTLPPQLGNFWGLRSLFHPGPPGSTLVPPEIFQLGGPGWNRGDQGVNDPLTPWSPQFHPDPPRNFQTGGTRVEPGGSGCK